MYIGKGLIRYSSHGEVQCYHMLKSTSLIQVMFPRSPSLLDSCFPWIWLAPGTQAVFENITSPRCHIQLSHSAGLLSSTTITEKPIECAISSSLSLLHCFVTPDGLSLVSRPAEVARSRRRWAEVEADMTDPTSGVGSCVDQQTGGGTWHMLVCSCWSGHSFIHSFIGMSNGCHWI